MKKHGLILNDVLIGLLLDIPLVTVLAFGTIALRVTFPAFGLFDVVSRLLPGQIVISTIEVMVKIIRALNLGATDTSAKTAERLMAIGLFVITATVASVIYFAVVRRRVTGDRRNRLISGITLGAVSLVPILFLTSQDTGAAAPLVLSLSWLIVVFLLWGLAHGVTFARLSRAPLPSTAMDAPPVDQPEAAREAVTVQERLSRRQFLVELGGASAVITLVGVGLDIILTNQPGFTPSAIATEVASGIDSAGLLMPAPGTRSEYTPLAKHYRIDINAGSGPHIDENTYKLDIRGLVDNPTQLSLNDLRTRFQAMDQVITMSCISNPVAGDLISTTRWTGLSMQDILTLVKPKPEATHLRITSADGFWEVVELAAIQKDPRIMLAYAWDGQPLTQEHGFPLRIHVADHYGMKQPKWITTMEFISQWEPGYWVQRGWDREARVRATSVIDTVAKDQLITNAGAQLVPVGGIAWAGARGISKVEVRVDNGDWTPAQLRKPLSDKAWVVWRYDWPFNAGPHTFAVRCVETNETPQIDTAADTYPAGATGIHSVKTML